MYSKVVRNGEQEEETFFKSMSYFNYSVIRVLRTCLVIGRTARSWHDTALNVKVNERAQPERNLSTLNRCEGILKLLDECDNKHRKISRISLVCLYVCTLDCVCDGPTIKRVRSLNVSVVFHLRAQQL